MLPASPVLPSHPDSKELEVVYGKDQPQFLPLPGLYVPNIGTTVTRWRLTWRDRFAVLLGGNVWLNQVNSGQPLQAQRPTVFEPFTKADMPKQPRQKEKVD